MKTVEKIERKSPARPRRKRVAAYARVSVESARMQHSLSAQISYYSALIQKTPEWEYAGVYADYGISGTGMCCTARQQMTAVRILAERVIFTRIRNADSKRISMAGRTRLQ